MFSLSQLVDRLPAYRDIPVADAGEVDILSSLFQGHSTVVSTAAASTDIQLYNSRQPGNPTEAQFYYVANQCRAAIVVFTESGWFKSAREIRFTKPFQSCSALHVEACNAGDEGVIKKVKAATSAMSAAKALCEGIRHLQRSSEKLFRQVQLAVPACIVKDYVKSIGLAPAVSFQIF